MISKKPDTKTHTLWLPLLQQAELVHSDKSETVLLKERRCQKLSGVMDTNKFIFLNVVVVLQLCNYV